MLDCHKICSGSGSDSGSGKHSGEIHLEYNTESTEL